MDGPADDAFSTAARPGDRPLTAGDARQRGIDLHLRADFAGAVTAYESGLADSTSHPAEQALLRAWLASACFMIGNAARCRELAEEALVLAGHPPDDRAAAAAHTSLALAAALRGDRQANATHYERALAHAEAAGDLLQVARIRCNRGAQQLEEGEFGTALVELEHSLRASENGDADYFRALALLNRGLARLGLGRLEDAADDLVLARATYQRIGSRMAGSALAHLGDVHREQGDYALARACYEEAVATAEAVGDVQSLGFGLAGLARVLVDDEPERADAIARRSIDLGPVLSQQHALLAGAWVAFDRHDLATACDRASTAAEIARARRDRAVVAESLLVSALAQPDRPRVDLVEEAREIWRRLGNPLGMAKGDLALAELGSPDATQRASAAEEAFRSIGARRLAAIARRLADRAESAPRVAVRTLGGFQVLLHGAPLPAAEWGSKKARDLLKILLARRGQRIPREVLADLLWPGEDPSRTAPRLSVALSTLRAALDPDRSYEDEHPVQADRAAAWLVLEVVEVDVERFLGEAARGLAAHRGGLLDQAWEALSTAESRYTGEFLEEDAYESWATGLREEARNVYITVAFTLAGLAGDRGDHDAVTRYLYRVLARDPYDERAHLALVASLETSGRRGDARRAYKVYLRRMEEIDVDPLEFPQSGVRRLRAV